MPLLEKEQDQVLGVGAKSPAVAMLRLRCPLDIQAERSSWRFEPMERSTTYVLSMNT